MAFEVANDSEDDELCRKLAGLQESDPVFAAVLHDLAVIKLNKGHVSEAKSMFERIRSLRAEALAAPVTAVPVSTTTGLDSNQTPDAGQGPHSTSTGCEFSVAASAASSLSAVAAPEPAPAQTPGDQATATAAAATVDSSGPQAAHRAPARPRGCGDGGMGGGVAIFARALGGRGGVLGALGRTATQPPHARAQARSRTPKEAADEAEGAEPARRTAVNGSECQSTAANQELASGNGKGSVSTHDRKGPGLAAAATASGGDGSDSGCMGPTSPPPAHAATALVALVSAPHGDAKSTPSKAPAAAAAAATARPCAASSSTAPEARGSQGQNSEGVVSERGGTCQQPLGFPSTLDPPGPARPPALEADNPAELVRPGGNVPHTGRIHDAIQVARGRNAGPAELRAERQEATVVLPETESWEEHLGCEAAEAAAKGRPRGSGATAVGPSGQQPCSRAVSARQRAPSPSGARATSLGNGCGAAAPQQAARVAPTATGGTAAGRVVVAAASPPGDAVAVAAAAAAAPVEGFKRSTAVAAVSAMLGRPVSAAGAKHERRPGAGGEGDHHHHHDHHGRGSDHSGSEAEPDGGALRAMLGECTHVLEVYGLTTEVRTAHLEEFVLALAPQDGRPLPMIKWVDDHHALLVCPDRATALFLMQEEQDVLQLRPFTEASAASRAVAPAELLPPRERPKTTAAVAKKMLSHALGMGQLRDKAAERELAQQRKAAREARREREQKLAAAWDED